MNKKTKQILLYSILGIVLIILAYFTFVRCSKKVISDEQLITDKTIAVIKRDSAIQVLKDLNDQIPTQEQIIKEQGKEISDLKKDIIKKTIQYENTKQAIDTAGTSSDEQFSYISNYKYTEFKSILSK